MSVTPPPKCRRCQKQVDSVTCHYDQVGVIFVAHCHGEQESATIPWSWLKTTIGPAQVVFSEAFTEQENSGG